jgi:hypothetical protein
LLQLVFSYFAVSISVKFTEVAFEGGHYFCQQYVAAVFGVQSAFVCCYISHCLAPVLLGGFS